MFALWVPVDESKSFIRFLSSYVSSLSVCIFVALCVRISVAGANKVEGTMRWCVGTNEILASYMTFTRLKVKQGHFETAILILHNFFVFLLRLKVFRSITLKYLYDFVGVLVRRNWTEERAWSAIDCCCFLLWSWKWVSTSFLMSSLLT